VQLLRQTEMLHHAGAVAVLRVTDARISTATPNIVRRHLEESSAISRQPETSPHPKSEIPTPLISLRGCGFRLRWSVVGIRIALTAWGHETRRAPGGLPAALGKRHATHRRHGMGTGIRSPRGHRCRIRFAFREAGGSRRAEEGD
jgi:hypothetical protein